MHKVIEAMIDETGRVLLSEPFHSEQRQRALVIVLDDDTIANSANPNNAVSRYELGTQLGAGGMGEAFVGKDRQSGQKVCIKRLRPGLGYHLLDQEWRSLARVESKYVVRYLDQFRQNESLHIVMEYIDGPTLSKRIWPGLTGPEIVWLGLTLMQGVSAFHEANIIHCDLKPENILICDETMISANEPSWIPKIIDFGLAVLDRRDADGVETGAGRVAGTPAYMAPEQVNGWMLSAACDVYAVGVILYEALSGRRAFEGDTYSILRSKLQLETGLQLDRLPPGLPLDIADLVERCTNPNPTERPTSLEASHLLSSFYTTTASVVSSGDGSVTMPPWTSQLT